MHPITLLTDFGTGSPYVASMKGVILSLHPAAAIVDLSHEVPPQDVRRAAIILDDVARLFPPGTLHVCVVDPGVGTSRALVYASIGAQHFLAPDNGLLSLLARRIKPSRVIRIVNDRYYLQPVSSTFHGRDILAPVAARTALGMEPGVFGPPQESLAELSWPEARRTESQIEGEVLAVDHFGNVITSVPADMIEDLPTRKGLQAACAGRTTEAFVKTYGDRPVGTLVMLAGSTLRMEISIVGGNAAAAIGAKPGDPVVITWQAPLTQPMP